MRALVWFRHDLRVGDHPALWHACEAADQGVVGVFTVCPRQWSEEHDWSSIKVGLLLKTLGDLSLALRAINVPLKIVTAPDFAAVPEAVSRLMDACRCDRLYLNREYAWNEARRDEAVERAMAKAGRTVHAFHGSVILPPGSVRTKSGDGFYTVYSPFRRACTEIIEEHGLTGLHDRPRAQPAIEVAPDDPPSWVAGFDPDPPGLDLWTAGERRASARLSGFIETSLSGYKARRDFPGDEATSTLSPDLHLGTVSPSRCLAAAMEANAGRLGKGDEGAVCWMSEVLWREFYRHVLHGFPRVSKGRSFRPEFERLPWRHDPAGLAAWQDGRTGYPIVDAAMRCLRKTGWMHNRLRMVVAMFLTKHLLIDWREGERFFMRHLVDGDLGSNNGGWQWSASTGTDAQPYFRIFNPITQSRRFDPGGAFIRRWVPELDTLDDVLIHEPQQAGLAASRLDYPQPIVEHALGRDRAIEVFERVRRG